MLCPFVWPSNDVAREKYTNKAKLILSQIKDLKTPLRNKLFSGKTILSILVCVYLYN